jgi:hypothetical protein
MSLAAYERDNPVLVFAMDGDHARILKVSIHAGRFLGKI